MTMINALLTILAFSLVDFSSHAAYFDPSFAELARYLSVEPDSNWGSQARASKSLRILAIGGSNTANDEEKQGYVRLLEGYILTNIENDFIETKTSYVLNNGVSGMTPTYFFGKTFDFENRETLSWPNVVLLEFTVNIEAVGECYEAAMQYESLVHFLKMKWKAKGLPYPDFVLLELMKVTEAYQNWEKYPTKESRLNQFKVQSVSTGFNRGSYVCGWIDEYARFYHYPVVSWRSVGFPAFARHYLKNIGVDYRDHNKSWPYSHDGIHMSPKACNYVVDNMLGPFFAAAMQPRTELTQAELTCDDNSICDYEFRMFAPQTIPKIFGRWNCWEKRQANTLQEVVVPTADWGFEQMHGHEDGHLAYCSHVQDSVARFHIPVSGLCTEANPCEISIGALYSWNESYIGDALCSVTMHGSFHEKERGAVQSLEIRGQHATSQQMTSTVPHDKVLAVNVTEGHYEIECRNLLADRYTCIIDIDFHGHILT